MEERIKELTAEMVKNVGASSGSLNELGKKLGLNLPADYIDFMTETNGATGFVGPNSFLQVWSVEEVVELNNSVEDISEEHGEWLFFGGMGGGSWYAFDTRYEPMPVVEVDMNDPDYNYVRGASFAEFLENLYTAEE